MYGVDILDVKEINADFSFTPISHAPDEIRGYVNIRGQIHLLLNLGLLLDLPDLTENSSKKMIVFKSTIGEPFGIEVDKVGDVVNVLPQQIEDRRKTISTDLAEERRSIENNLIKGICKMEQTLMMILQAKNLLPTIENLEYGSR